MSKNFIFLLIAFSCISMQAEAQKILHGAEKLIVRGSDNYPPFEYINSRGEPDGFNVDIFKALMDELGYTYELKLENWDKVVVDIQAKRIDAVIGMIYSPERASTVRFTLPTCVINRNIITREHDEYHSLEELKGKELIVEKGGWFHRYLLDNDFGATIIESNDIEQSLALLTNGKHYAVLASELVATYAIKKHDYKGLKMKSMGIDAQNYAIAVNQDNDELLYQINLGLQRIKLSGVYDQIYNKWFGIYEHQKSRKSLFIALGIFLFIASWLLAFVLLLRNRVSRATRLLSYSQQEVGIAIDAGNISAWAYIIHFRQIHALHGKPFGITNDSIDNVYEKVHPEDVDMVRSEFDALSTGRKKSTDISFRVCNNLGEPYCYVETKMVRVESTKEQPCRIVGTLKDVTEEIIMKQRIEDYSLKTRFIIETNGLILIQYDIRSQTFIRIVDFDATEEVKYTADEYLSIVHPEDAAIARQFTQDMNEAVKSNVESEFRFMVNGAYVWMIITAVAYRYDSNGNIVSYIGFRRDNTKWKTINSDLILLRERADASNILKSTFLCNISHEIRTPLNAIVGFSELLMDTENQNERKQFFEIIQTNNALLLQLVSDVLDLSNVESGQDILNYSNFNFALYFRQLCQSFKSNETSNVKLLFGDCWEALEVSSDQDRISQVVSNFINNAFKFTQKGTVLLDYVQENGGVKIMVTDTGIGISENNLSRIFERFEKVDSFIQGTGLGLSVCVEIATALHGKVGVESQLGKGSTFWLWFPQTVSQ